VLALSAARRVLIVAHIAPGTDSFTFAPTWKSPYDLNFTSILAPVRTRLLRGNPTTTTHWLTGD
jgi:hypothetical protein